MANKWITWGLEEAPLTNLGELLLFLIIADSANPDGYAWPGNKTLAKYMRMEGRSVQRIMRRLEKKKLVAVFERKRKNGSDTSNGYQLLKGADTKIVPPDDWKPVARVTDVSPSPHDSPVIPPDDRRVTPPMTDVSSLGATGESSPEPLVEPSMEPKERTIAPSGAVPLSSSSLEASSTDDMGQPQQNQEAAAPEVGTSLYPCTSSDVTAMIAAWMNWAPVLPTRRGKVISANEHYANKTMRDYAQVLWERGYRPNDIIDWWQVQRAESLSKDKAIEPMSFVFVAERVERFAPQRRAMTIYTHDCPRCFPWKPEARNGNAEAEALMLWMEGLEDSARDLGYSIDMPVRLFTAAEYALLKAGKPLPDYDYEEAI